MPTLKPSLGKTIIRSYLRSAVKPTPLWVHYYITRHCNFDCQYCGARDNKRKDPTLAEVKKTLLKIKELGCNSVSFMGGEPTLRPDIVEIVEFCSKNNIYTQIPSNGAFLLLKKDGKTLLKRLVKAGLGMLNLSVDSAVAGFKVSGKEVPKSNEVLDALIEENKRSGLKIMLNCVISKQNIDQVPTMLEFCHKKGVVMAAVFVQHPYQFRSETKNIDYSKILFGKKDADKVKKTADYLIKMKKAGYGLLEPIDYYQAIKKWIDGEIEWECGGGKTSLNIDTDGRVGICGYVDYTDLNITDLNKDYYEKIRDKAEEYKKYCTKKCIPSCMYCTTYYTKNPLVLLVNKIKYKS